MKFIEEMRVKQWTKNLLVYAALLFNGTLFDGEKFFITSLAFAAFCLASSGVYFINDVFDYEKDRVNPDKFHRPIASGAISLRAGIFSGGGCCSRQY